MAVVKVAMIQQQGAYEKEKNVAKARQYIRQAAQNGARIICLQELFNTIYFCFEENAKYFDWAETIPGPTTDAIAEVARQEGVVVVCPIYERSADVKAVRYNAAAVLGAQGELMGIYRKHSIPLVRTESLSANEKFYFNVGNTGFPVFQTPFGVNVGIVICYDRHFPEGPRSVALNGADIMFVPTATWGMSRPIWEIELKGHAVFNLFYVGGVNRVGLDERGNPKGNFYGSSIFVTPLGEITATASDQHDDIIYSDVDTGVIERIRDDWGLYRDRRPDAYGALAAAK
ncbi:MAG: nitrilase-related carbon-nitrogen hydrolase [Candidatus Binatia bacterium]